MNKTTQCLKILEKVSFDIASYVYINGQKFIKMVNFASFFKPKDDGQTVLPDRSLRKRINN